MRDVETLLPRLIDTGMEFVIVGGFAAVAHGATRLTQDLDVCCPFTDENLRRLIAAIGGLNPRFRGPSRRALPETSEELAGFKNLYLETDLGELDVLGEIAGIGSFPAVRARSEVVTLWARAVRILQLDALVESKRALARGKDLEALRELEVILARQQKP